MTCQVGNDEFGWFLSVILRFSVLRKVRGAMREVRHGCRYDLMGWITIEADDWDEAFWPDKVLYGNGET